MTTITALFETRRDAELVVEHLVQDHDFDRGDISIESATDENSAGTEASGADLDAGEEDDDSDAALGGPIKLLVTIADEDTIEDVQDILLEFGASDVEQE